jgi:hypothetical protein
MVLCVSVCKTPYGTVWMEQIILAGMTCPRKKDSVIRRGGRRLQKVVASGKCTPWPNFCSP